jgi:hypothetical protein
MRLIVPVLPCLAIAAPCTQASRTCMERVSAGESGYFLVYRNQPLTQPSPDIERIVILVHGLEREGDSNFRTAIRAAQETGEMDRTLVIAPQFHAKDGKCKDKLERGEIAFACQGWSDGIGTKAARFSSFAAMDGLVQMVASRELFPALKEVVIAGHSAGGQFVQRYAAANRIDGRLAVPIRYIAANPSSYLYLESWRPVQNAGAHCRDFNRYKYGLDGLTSYVAESGAVAIRNQYPHRDVTYLLGELDTTDEHHMDTTCPAKVQGPNRRQRGLSYFERLRLTFHSEHKMITVPGCGHSADCMFRSENGVRAVFGQ